MTTSTIIQLMSIFSFQNLIRYKKLQNRVTLIKSLGQVEDAFNQTTIYWKIYKPNLFPRISIAVKNGDFIPFSLLYPQDFLI